MVLIMILAKLHYIQFFSQVPIKIKYFSDV